MSRLCISMLSLQATTVTNLLYSIPSWVQADVLIWFFFYGTDAQTYMCGVNYDSNNGNYDYTLSCEQWYRSTLKRLRQQWPQNEYYVWRARTTAVDTQMHVQLHIICTGMYTHMCLHTHTHGCMHTVFKPVPTLLCYDE